MKTNWDKRHLEHACFISYYSKDPSTKVGAVIVRPDNTIASVGFNGMPRGANDDVERMEQDRDWKLARTLHAEVNAILSAREPLHGYTIAVWPLAPCSHCAAAIIQAGIKRVIVPHFSNERWAHSCNLGYELFEECGVEVIKQ